MLQELLISDSKVLGKKKIEKLWLHIYLIVFKEF